MQVCLVFDHKLARIDYKLCTYFLRNQSKDYFDLLEHLSGSRRHSHNAHHADQLPQPCLAIHSHHLLRKSDIQAGDLRCKVPSRCGEVCSILRFECELPFRLRRE